MKKPISTRGFPKNNFDKSYAIHFESVTPVLLPEKRDLKTLILNATDEQAISENFSRRSRGCGEGWRRQMSVDWRVSINCAPHCEAPMLYVSPSHIPWWMHPQKWPHHDVDNNFIIDVKKKKKKEEGEKRPFPRPPNAFSWLEFLVFYTIQ